MRHFCGLSISLKARPTSPTVYGKLPISSSRDPDFFIATTLLVFMGSANTSSLWSNDDTSKLQPPIPGLRWLDKGFTRRMEVEKGIGQEAPECQTVWGLEPWYPSADHPAALTMVCTSKLREKT